MADPPQPADYHAIRLISRYGRFAPYLVAAPVAIALTVIGVRSREELWFGLAIGAALAGWFLTRLCVEIVWLVADTLMPR